MALQRPPGLHIEGGGLGGWESIQGLIAPVQTDGGRAKAGPALTGSSLMDTCLADACSCVLVPKSCLGQGQCSKFSAASSAHPARPGVDGNRRLEWPGGHALSNSWEAERTWVNLREPYRNTAS